MMRHDRRSRILTRATTAIGIILLLVAVSTGIAAEGNSSLLVRARAIAVVPDESSRISTIGGKVDVDESVMPELDITYFFTDHIAVELVLALSLHDVSAENTSAGDLDLGDVLLLPPVLSLQYHALPESSFRPYVGVGINYTTAVDEDPGVATDIDYDDAVGLVLGVGCDFSITDRLCLNVDVKKAFLSTDVEVQALGSTVTADVDLDPWIYSVGLGCKF